MLLIHHFATFQANNPKFARIVLISFLILSLTIQKATSQFTMIKQNHFGGKIKLTALSYLENKPLEIKLCEFFKLTEEIANQRLINKLR